MKPARIFFRGWGFSFVLISLLSLFCACKYELVKEPTFNYNDIKNAADYNDFILAPSGLTASHGLSRMVSLEWESVPNAVQYYIYSAQTPYDTFTKVSETKAAETQIVIDEESGITKYYCVCAVNYYGTVSLKSTLACGSTLSVPIITEITSAEEGDSLTVKWWMDNCRQNTYENNISYEISVYLNATSNIKLKTLTASGDSRSVVADDLQSKTEYFFTVEAINSNNKDREISSRTSALTAHRVIPAPPQNFTVTQGLYSDKVILSWKLPPKVWYRTSSGSSGFELYPLYFEIYRREAGTDAPFEMIKKETIASYPDDSTEDRSHTYVDSRPASSRGKQFEYYVQSFTDGLSGGKIVTADSSKTSVEKGWPLALPKLSIRSDYAKEGNTFTSITFSPNLDFQAFEVPYTYKLTRSGQALPGQTFAGPVSENKSFTSINELNNYSDLFPKEGGSLAGQKGYYSYSLAIYLDDALIDTAESSVRYLVTDDASAIPVIENFTIKEGYKDKFVLSWKYNSSYSYNLYWKDYVTGEEEVVSISASGTNGQTFTYNHAASSGDQRNYRLEAVKEGLSTFAYPNNDEGEKFYKTLGKPAPVIAEYDYDKIIVKWDAVQMATDSYTVSAKYQGQSAELTTTSNTSITANENNSVFTCVITNPAGYDNAALSGKNINLTVSASSKEQSNETSQETIDVCTVGPANTNLLVGNPSHNEIVINWNEVTGAQGYIIRRICGKNTFVSEPASSADLDLYYYDGTSLTCAGQSVDSKRAQVTKTGNVYKLTDKYCEPDDSTSSYENNQSCISWGIPYSYCVIPVKAQGSADDFTFDGSDVLIKGSQAYTNLSHKEAATYGYGLMVQAAKSESSTKQVLEWTRPYIKDDSLPSFYYRTAGSTTNTWIKINDYELITETKAEIVPESTIEAYEYLVAYKRASAGTVPPSLIADTKLGLSAEETRSKYTYASNVNKEKANKGYLLAVELYAITDSGYSEKVYWNSWDYNYRSIGPDSAELRIKNYNISNAWLEFVSLDKDLYYSSKNEPANTTVTQVDEVTINIKPTKIMDQDSSLKVTPGYMQVLRDAKHYYSLVLTRGELNCVVADDDSVGAYRDIGEKEYAKMIMIIVNEALKKMGTLGDSVEEANDGYGGYAKFKHKSAASTEYDFEFKNYAPKLTMPSGQSARILSITCPKDQRCDRDQIGIAGYPKSFETFTLTCTRIDDKMPESYNGTLTFSMEIKDPLFSSLTFTATISVNNHTTITMNSMEARRLYIPFAVWKDENYYDENSSYGWWTE